MRGTPYFGSQELGALVEIGLPLALANLGQVLIGLVEVALLGRLGLAELGAGGLGSSIYFTFAVFGTGAVLGFEPAVTQAASCGQRHRLLWQGMWLGLALGLPLGGAAWLTAGQLERFGIGSDCADLTRSYLLGRLPGLPFALAAVAARSALQAAGGSRRIAFATLIAVAASLPSGVLASRIGIAGVAWTATGASVLQLGMLLRFALTGGSVAWPRPGLMRQGLGAGAPLGAALVVEYGVFLLVNVAIARLDPAALASHQVVMTFVGASFVVPLGIGSAAAVRVGRAVGRGDPKAPREIGSMAMLIGGGIMLVVALVFWAMPATLSGWLTQDASVVRLAIPLFFIAGCLQLGDGVQVVAAGALRGAGDTRSPLLANLIGHYLVGVPLGVGLAVGGGLGAQGIWWGLGAGITTVAGWLVARFWRITRAPIDLAWRMASWR